MSAKMSSKKVAKILESRRMGLYHTQDTLDEVKLCLKQMTESDEVFTLFHATGTFGVLDKNELLFQMREWKRLRCQALECNVMEKEVDGKKVWMFVIQPPDLEKGPSFCPLAVALGVMVSGYTYIAKNKSTADLVVRYLSK